MSRAAEREVLLRDSLQSVIVAAELRIAGQITDDQLEECCRHAEGVAGGASSPERLLRSIAAELVCASLALDRVALERNHELEELRARHATLCQAVAETVAGTLSREGLAQLFATVMGR